MARQVAQYSSFSLFFLACREEIAFLEVNMVCELEVYLLQWSCVTCIYIYIYVFVTYNTARGLCRSFSLRLPQLGFDFQCAVRCFFLLRCFCFCFSCRLHNHYLEPFDVLAEMFSAGFVWRHNGEAIRLSSEPKGSFSGFAMFGRGKGSPHVHHVQS